MVLGFPSRPGGAWDVLSERAFPAPVCVPRVSPMGIPGLLPLLGAAALLVADFWKTCRNKRCAFDGHVWLHTFCLVHYVINKAM